MLSIRKNSGFTLIELSIVLAIISVFLGMILLSTQARIAEAKIYLTKEKMQVVMDALDKYVKTYGYLPCPSPINVDRTNANYGYGVGSNTNDCSSAIDIPDAGGALANGEKGAVPFMTLGLNADAAVDGWGNRFSYIVVQGYTYGADYQNYALIHSGIRIWTDATGTSPITGTDIAYVLISHGPNGSGSFLDKDGAVNPSPGSDAEDQNSAGGGTIFVSMPPTNDFDDITVYRSRWQLPKYFPR